MNEGKIQWHSAFTASMQVELQQELNRITMESEHLLGKKPMQIDLLIIKKEKDQLMAKNIARIFRIHNIIEYKSPDDYLSINDFYRVYGYTCFYQADTEKIGAIDPGELTITFACYHYPYKLLRHLQKVRGMKVIFHEPGIYELEGDPIPMQLLIINRLSKSENYWMQVLRDDLQSGGEIQELLERYESKKDLPNYQALMDVVTRANWKKVEEEKKMCDALREMFADDLREAREKAQAEGRAEGWEEGRAEGWEEGREEGRTQSLQKVAANLKQMGMTVEYIAQAVGMPAETVIEWL